MLSQKYEVRTQKGMLTNGQKKWQSAEVCTAEIVRKHSKVVREF